MRHFIKAEYSRVFRRGKEVNEFYKLEELTRIQYFLTVAPRQKTVGKYLKSLDIFHDQIGKTRAAMGRAAVVPIVGEVRQ